MRLPLIIIIIFKFFFINAQTLDRGKFINLADSLVLIRTNSTFFKELTRDTLIQEFKYVSGDSIIDFDRLSKDNKYYKSVEQIDNWIEYRLKPQRDFTYHVINKLGGMGPTSFIIQIDKNYQFKELPDFILYVKSLERFNNRKVIDKKTAISFAQNYFSKKSRDSHMCMLIFDIRDNSLYWRVTRHCGFRNVIEEHVLIDANKKEFLRKETNEYFRNFWMTIGDVFQGFY